MCGICGFTGRSDRAVLHRMTGTLAHRGPDEDGFFFNESVSLGMQRLSIVDLSSGQQPVRNEDGTVRVIFNGEIYNHVELRQKLGDSHYFYTDHSDTEVIVHLYETYGLDFVHHLNGMFSIALWDSKKDSLVLIRDRMGVKPLFYTIARGELIFGSEIKAILSHPAYSKQINFKAIYHYFSFKNIPSPLTAFEGIHSLRPGEMFIWEKGRCEKKQWWKIKFNEQANYEENYVQHSILSLLEDATKIRMGCDVPFGAYLSGGVDSSAIVALMSRFSEKPIKTFSLGYEDNLKNKQADLYHARRVSKAFNTKHHEYIMSAQELRENVEDVICAFDQPFSGTISTYFLSKLIKKHVKVALSGDGADELFGSYLTHRVARPMYHYTRLHSRVQQGNLTKKERMLLDPITTDFLENLYGKSKGNEAAWRTALYLGTDEEKHRLLSPWFLEKVKEVSTLAFVRHHFHELTAKDPLNRILEMEWNTQLPDQVLAFVDFLSMSHSIEVRSPFLDYRLVEFAATIPGTMKIRNGMVKAILKQSVEEILPGGITNRPKEGFVLPIYSWMFDTFPKYCKDILSKERIVRHGFFKFDTVNSMLDQYYRGDETFAGKIWNLMMFQVWWEKYFG